MNLAFLDKINISSVLKRFPLPILVSSIIGIISLLLVEKVIKTDLEAFRIVMKLLHVLVLLFASFALLSIARINNTSIKNKYLFYVGGVAVFAVLYYFLLPAYPGEKHVVQTVGLVFVLHLLITVIPFWKNQDLKQFWAYNKTLLLRFLEASIYTLFIFLSLSVAIVALEKLFGISFKPLEIYGDLWIILLSLFHPLYFFSRFPEDLVFDNKELENSLAFRVFSRRILLPVVILYGVILLAYVLKIVFQWSWPRGWVSNMVLWFSVFGILAYLLNYIRLDKKEGRFVNMFKKYYFHYQAIMSIVLMLAVYKRISDYGVTEPRYIVASLSLWLSLISCYFVISKEDNIKWIPISLAIFTLIATVGPMNMYSTTVNSQFSRFSKELTKAGMLKDGVLLPAQNLSKKTEHIISQGLSTLNNRNALKKLNKYKGLELQLKLDSFPVQTAVSPLDFGRHLWGRSDTLLLAYARALNITPNFYYHASDNRDYFTIYTEATIDTPLAGFDELIQIKSYYVGKNKTSRIHLSDDKSSITFTTKDNEKQNISLTPFIEKYKDRFAIDPQHDQIEFESSTQTHRFKFFIQSANGTINNGIYTFQNMDGFVLVKEKAKH